MATTATVSQGSHSDNIGYITKYSEEVHSWLTSMEADILFQSSCAYDHGDSDQYDWNKLIGFAYTSFGTTSARWGWRWNLVSQKVEIAPYVNDGGTVLLPPSSQWIQVDLNTWFNAKIEVDRANERYIFTYNGSTVHYVNVSSSLASAYSSNDFIAGDLFFFGGTKSAPHEMKIDYDNIRFTAKPRVFYVTGEATNGVTFTGTKADGSQFSQFIAMNESIETPCLEPYSINKTNVTVSEGSIC